jgi:ATP-binding cassette, subfamily B, bacterial CvaB/MchF/RaxB
VLSQVHSKLKPILQVEASECGLACLTMLANYHGHYLDLASLRRRYPTSSAGTSLTSLIEIASALNLESRAVRVSVEDIASLTLPAMLHWEMRHFVVLSKMTTRGVKIIDPAVGEKSLTWNDFRAKFSGTALEIRKAANFVAQKETVRLNHSLYTRQFFRFKISAYIAISAFILSQVLTLSLPYQLQLVVNDLQKGVGAGHLLHISAFFFGISVLAFLTSILGSLTISRISVGVNRSWCYDICNQLLRLPLPFFEKRHLSDVVSRFNSIKSVQGSYTSILPSLITDVIFAFTALVLLTISCFKIALYVIAVSIIYGIIRVLLSENLRRKSEEGVILQSQQYGAITENVRSIATIKAAGKQAARLRHFDAIAAELSCNELSTQRVVLTWDALDAAVLAFQRIGTLTLGAVLVLRGNLALGSLLAFVLWSEQYSFRSSSAIDKLQKLSMVRPNIERISDITDATPERGEEEIDSHFEPAGGYELHGVGFSHDNKNWIFRNLNLEIPDKSSIAIIGPSGCGKSTLAKMLLGLYDPTEGDITRGGVSLLKHGPKKFRNNVAAVLQGEELFQGTIAENITFFNSAATISDIVDVAKLASLHDEIIRLPMGYETRVHAASAILSGGQKQRLFIARALYQRPRILILDEATSHLDAVSERLINSAINELSCTRIIIAHRRETIESATLCFDMRHGRLISNKALIEQRKLNQVSSRRSFIHQTKERL